MKVQIFSDLHLEGFRDPNIIWEYVTPQAPVAVVAGDINSREFEHTCNIIASKFEHVIVVLGNHEWYKKDISWRPDQSKLADNVHVLNQGVYEHDDVVFIGATLWSDFKNQDWFVMDGAKRGINDFHIIRNGAHNFTPHLASDFHRKDKQYLQMMINKFADHDDKKIVVVTHFMPSYQCVNERWRRNPGTDTLNYYFSANCDDMFDPDKINLWICGHTHDNVDMCINDVRVVCNPLGYYGEKDFKDLVVEV
jgi:Icc-related predicted phosphoesterase